MDRFIGPRRNPDQIGNRPSRLAANPPDRKSPSTVRLGEATVRISSRETVYPDCQITSARAVTRWGQVDNQTIITPEIKKPLVPHRKIGVAGGRTIGGGTSIEAQRRARRKSQTRG